MTIANFRALPLVVMSVLATAPALAQDVTTEPEAVLLMVDDVRRMADVLHALEPGSDTLEVLEEDYLGQASPGLRVYAQRYDLTSARIVTAMADHPRAYADLDRLASAILAQEPALEEGFRRLRDLFPQAAFPPIWFVVGDYGPGGLTRQEGVVVAAERYAERSDDVVPLVLHELAHFQQAMVQGVEQYQRIYGPDKTLLALALREGTADLVAELTTGRHINPDAERYGLANEKELWLQFRRDMHNREPGDWMFVKPSNVEWPPDLGYWIGYRIAKRYYEQAEDERQALYALLSVKDYRAILSESEYADGFEE